MHDRIGLVAGGTRVPQRKSARTDVNLPAAGLAASSRQGVQPATVERFWRFTQRYVSFEEPGSRWQRLEHALRSQLPRNNSGNRNFDGLDAAGKIDLMLRLVGNPQFDVPELLLTAVLAFEDFAVFEPVAFESWQKKLLPSVTPDSSGSAASELFDSARLVALRHGHGAEDVVEAIGEACRTLSRPALEMGYSTAQVLWLSTSLWIRPCWSQLRMPGEWSADARARFLLAFLDRAAGLGRSPSLELLTEARALFQSMRWQYRSRLPGSFLPELVLLVEGPTEAMLLPFFSKCLGTDLDALGVTVIAAGGSNQVVRRYLELRDTVSLPIVVVLDADARAHASLVEDMLREQDRLHVLSAGEIEDVFEIESFVRLVNEHLDQSGPVNPISVSDFNGRQRRTVVLDRLWKKRGLGRFDKIGFAGTVVNSELSAGEVPEDLVKIRQSVQQLLGGRLGRRDKRQR